MKLKKLGDSDLAVAPLAFGGNVFGWTVDEKTSHELLDQFTDNGFNLIDTANSYSRWVPGHQGGESERIIGTWLKSSGKRDKVLIATKVGSDMGLGKPCLKKNHIMEQVEGSLKRLNIEQIDLYQSHFDDLETPVSETIEAFDELIRQGKVKFIGASNLSPQRLLESLQYSKENNLHRYISLQPEYNLFSRKKFEEEYMNISKSENLAVITYFSLASGFLTGKYRNDNDYDKSKRGAGMKKYMNARGFAILEALDKISSKYKVGNAAVSLAWLLTRPMVVSPIASATNVSQLAELIEGVQLVLDESDIKILDEASAY